MSFFTHSINVMSVTIGVFRKHKAVPMSIHNLQGSIKTFGSQTSPFRCSNNDIHSTCTTNSIDLSASTSTRNGGVPPYSSASTARATSSMFNINSTATPRTQPNAAAIHSAQSFQHASNSGLFPFALLFISLFLFD